MNLLETIRETIGRHGLVPKDAQLVVGVSGGADSVALLHALHQLGFAPTVAHLNHRLRGADADADERFVRGLGFPVVVKSVDVKALAAKTGKSVEMAARQARHDFFAEFEDSIVALAHHADDQVETFFLRLARGAGTEGLGGMAFSQSIGPLRIIRPMLKVFRAEIVAWLESNGIAWREDASNADEAFLRNRLRHTVLPLLERELNPNLRETVLRTMDILQAENAWMEGMQDQSQTVAAKRRRLRKWLFEHGVEEAGFERVESILALMEKGCGTAVFGLGDGQRVVIEYGTPRFEHGGQAALPAAFRLRVERGTGWRKDHGKGAGILPAEASFDADKVGDSTIEVRGAEPGDRIEPLGMEGRRKLQDILTDQKIPRAQRPGIPVVVCRGEIIWIPGYRTARGWEVQGPGGKAVHVRIEHNGRG